MSTPQEPREPQDPQEPDRLKEPAAPVPPPEPEGSGGAPRRLTRSSSDRTLGGVAGGLGAYFGVDPLLFRVAFAVLAFAGGAGVLAYAALWAFVPTDEPGTPAPVAGRGSGTIVAVAGLVLALAILTGGPFPFFFGPGLLVAAIAALVVVAAVSSSRGAGLARPLAIVASVAGAFLAAVAGALITAAGGGVATAVLVLAAGALLVAAGFRGGARWLILPALALAAATAFVAAADIRLSGGVGERSYRPGSVGDIADRYEHGVGELSIDLRGVDFPAGEHRVEVELGVGEVRVLVPKEVCTAVRADVGLGGYELHGAGAGGIDIRLAEMPASPATVPRVVVDAHVGLGKVEVQTYDDEYGGFDGRGFLVPPRHLRDHFEGDACS